MAPTLLDSNGDSLHCLFCSVMPQGSSLPLTWLPFSPALTSESKFPQHSQYNVWRLVSGRQANEMLCQATMRKIITLLFTSSQSGAEGIRVSRHFYYEPSLIYTTGKNLKD